MRLSWNSIESIQITRSSITFHMSNASSFEYDKCIKFYFSGPNKPQYWLDWKFGRITSQQYFDIVNKERAKVNIKYIIA